MRQKSDISDHRSKVEGGFAPFNPYFVCNTAAGSLCDLSGAILHQNWKVPFLSQIKCWISFYRTSFLKKAVFSEKTVENFSPGENISLQNFTPVDPKISVQDLLPILGAPVPKILIRSFWPACNQTLGSVSLRCDRNPFVLIAGAVIIKKNRSSIIDQGA